MGKPTEPVFLRALEASDFERTHKWHNDPVLYKSLGSAMRFVSLAAEEQWLHKRLAFSEHEVNLAICLTGSEKHIGNIYLRGIDWIARHAELHILIGDADDRGRGHGRSAVRQLLAYVFNTLGLQKVYLSVLIDNDRAIRTYQDCGFVVEGTLKRHAFKNAVFRDVAIMAVYQGSSSTPKE